MTLTSNAQYLYNDYISRHIFLNKIINFQLKYPRCVPDIEINGLSENTLSAFIVKIFNVEKIFEFKLSNCDIFNNSTTQGPLKGLELLTINMGF